MTRIFTSILWPLPFLLIPLISFPPQIAEIPAPVIVENTPPMPLPCDCTVSQGSFSSALPFLSTNSSAVDFYSYGFPIGVSANTGLEMSNTMLLMLHEDTNTGNTSLIFILDQANDGSGGNVDVTFNCMPETAVIDLSDEPGEFSGAPPTFTGNFNWAACCTDGAIIGGVGCGSAFTINPTINSGIDVFSLVFGTDDNPNYVDMPDLNCPITINCEGNVCCDEAFEFSAIITNATCEESLDGSIDVSTDCASIPTFLWSNGSPTEDLFGVGPGTYTITITDINGCALSETYTIDSDSPNPVPVITGPTEFCQDDMVVLSISGSYASYNWSTGSMDPFITVGEPGIYSVTVTNTAGCTGTADFPLIENPLPEPEIMGPTGVCEMYDTIILDAGGGYTSYMWSTGSNSPTIEVTEFGGYFVTVTNIFGCSAFDLVLIDPLINPVPEITGPNAVCEGNPIALQVSGSYDAYQWSTGEFAPAIVVNSGGTYSVTVTNSDGCDGYDSQEITESPADTMFYIDSSCNPQDTGVFVETFTNQGGCDSVEITTVSYSESDSVYLSDQSCNPQDTGIFVLTFTNQDGCDSVEITTVTFNESDSVYITDQSCNPQDTGIFVLTFTNQDGCDSVEITTVSFNESDSVYLTDQSCNLQDTGIFVLTFTNQDGCDSVEITTVTFNESDSVYLTDQSCNPQDTGIFIQTLTNQNGCDSFVITTTAFILVDTTFLTDTNCDPTMVGVFEDQFTGSDGCDSLVITTVNLVLSDTSYLDANTCDIGQAGQSEILLTNQTGCDSLVITTTTFIPPDTMLFVDQNCDPSQVGVFQEVLENSFGCDSILITTITLLLSDTTEVSETSCDPAQSGIEEVLMTNQFGCDSLVIITTSYALADSTQIADTTCDPAAAGVFVEILMSADGCDSVVTSTISLLASDTFELMTTSCDPANVGIIETLFTNQNGCDSLVINTVELLLSDTSYQQASTCDISQAGQSEELFSNQNGCDSLVITTTAFIPPDTTMLVDASCDSSQVGTVEVVLQNTSGCDSLVIITTAYLLSDTTVLQAYSCDPGQVGMTEVLLSNSNGCDSLVITNTAPLPIDSTLLLFGSCSPADTGLVINTFSNQYGCDSLVFEQTDLLPAGQCELEALLVGDTIGCSETTGSIWATLLNGEPSFDYTWTDQDGIMGTGSINQSGASQQISGLAPGEYSFEIIDQDGLSTTMNASIFQPNPIEIDLQINADYNGYAVSCFGLSDGSATVNLLGGGLPPYTFIWSNGSETNQAENLGSGWSSVTITGAEGCEAIDSIFLESPENLEFNISVIQPDCFSEGLGAIAIEQIAGGVEPYQYSLGQSIWQTDPFFDDLPSGNYAAQMEDANACSASAFATINAATQLAVFLGQDETIEWGDSIALQPIIVPFSQLDSIYWGGVDCAGCLSATVAPLTNSTYSVTAVDSLGCLTSDEMQVFVEKDFRFYIPNAFSPNHNGINDNFTIFGNRHLVRILQLQIFDRWGEAVFTGFNLPPNDLTYGWDGTHRGQELNPAVFVYFAELEFVDGSTQLVEGDVMLVR